MTVEVTTTYTRAAGNGLTTVFNFSFKAASVTDLIVTDIDATGAVLIRTIITDYLVTLSSTSEGGSVAMTTAPLAGHTLDIRRVTALTQDEDIRNQGRFLPEIHEGVFDKETMQVQDLKRRTYDFGLHGPDNEGTAWPVLPAASARANLALIFDAMGLPAVGTPVPGTLTGSLIAGLLNLVTNAAPTADKVRSVGEIAAAVTPANFAYDPAYIERQGALADGATDALASINKAISVNSRRIRSYDGNFKVTAAPTNPNGIQFEGVGSLLLPTAFAFPKQLNSYADLHKYFIGREYLARVDLRLSVSNFGTTNLGCFLYGDSTIANSGITNVAFYAETLLPVLANHKGLTCALNVTNRGVGGTDVSSLNVIPDLSTATDFIVIKYGINDGLLSPATRLNTFSSTLRSKLAAIRAATNGDLPHLAILLMGPNATASDTDGRNEQWYEQLRGVFVQAARDYNCAYFDTYAMWKDSRPAANNWMDANTIGGQTNVPIHPNNLMQLWMWGAVMDFVFPDTYMDPYRSNYLQNIPQLVKTIPFATLPDNYDYGLTLHRALTTDGWPHDGSLTTLKHVNGPTWQCLTPTDRIAQIYCRPGSPGAWGIWYAEDTVTPALLNSWAAFATGSDAKAVKGGKIVSLSGMLKSGTVTNGTTLFVLPAGWRPRAAYWFTCPTNAGTAKISVDTGGNVVGQAGLDATFTSVSGISFEAVN